MAISRRRTAAFAVVSSFVIPFASASESLINPLALGPNGARLQNDLYPNTISTRHTLAQNELNPAFISTRNDPNIVQSHDSSKLRQVPALNGSQYHGSESTSHRGGANFGAQSIQQSSTGPVAKSEEEKYRTAVIKTLLTTFGALCFGGFLIATRGSSTGMEFFAGYLVEQSLSVDNLFVFIMLFDYFKVPLDLQDRVLTWGIIGAVALRGIMIAVGVAAIQKFKFVILLFAGVLILSSIKLLTESEGEHESLDENFVMKAAKLMFPKTTTEFHGQQFFWTNPEDGIKYATPLLMCLICVELSDFVFAVDSIPAVLGVSKDPMVVYASNIFAILALRSLYTIVAKAVTDLHYLKPAVALVLGFVGAKMVAEYFHFEISTEASLLVVSTLLGMGISASVWENHRKNKVQATS